MEVRLREFDNSLDSLLTGTVLYTSTVYTHDGNEILYNNPQEIKYIYEIVIDTNVVAVKANNSTIKFRNSRVESQSYESSNHVKKYVYFDKFIDNKKLDSLIKIYKLTDTLIFGRLEKFNKKGQLIKSVTATDNYRFLSVYKYDTLGRKTSNWQKSAYGSVDASHLHHTEYFYKEDSIGKIVSSEQLEKMTQNYYVANGRMFDHPKSKYTFDEFGNWIKEETFHDLDYRDVIIRKIKY
jgi:hypothetical protein